MTKRELKRQLRHVREDHAAGKSLSSILALPERESFMLAIQHYVCPPWTMTGWTWEKLLDLPPEPRIILVLSTFAGALFSSGIARFLIETRVLYEEVLDSCRTVGATRATEYLERAADCFPEGKLPRSNEECGDAIITDEDESATERCVRDLDARYRDAYDEVIDCLRRYITENLERFESARASTAEQRGT